MLEVWEGGEEEADGGGELFEFANVFIPGAGDVEVAVEGHDATEEDGCEEEVVVWDCGGGEEDGGGVDQGGEIGGEGERGEMGELVLRSSQLSWGFS